MKRYGIVILGICTLLIILLKSKIFSPTYIHRGFSHAITSSDCKTENLFSFEKKYRSEYSGGFIFGGRRDVLVKETYFLNVFSFRENKFISRKKIPSGYEKKPPTDWVGTLSPCTQDLDFEKAPFKHNSDLEDQLYLREKDPSGRWNKIRPIKIF